ncbi:HD domain-containing protein [Clostridium sp. LP20]|uniref:HD domain-containing protein n=1 Tax=Clostridium sp. LP20 TaxID=3418665 RepID=UPI003EE81E38
MIDLNKGKIAFKEYISQYDTSDDKIKLKLVHTYGVVAAAEFICKNEGLSREDTDLAMLIALLHDIGRFEQLKKFNSFDDNKFDHASFGVKVLFEDGLIGKFIETSKYDEIIRKAIEYHSRFKIPEGNNEKEELHIKLIRDADKLDNFRVKKFEKFETLFDISEEVLGAEGISENIIENVRKHEPILHINRKTFMDMWVSYLAFIFDLNFRASYLFLKENDYINSNINRINYTNPKTIVSIEEIRIVLLNFIDKNLSYKIES